MAFIPYGRQQVTEGDIAAVVEVLRSDWLTQGPVVPSFEQAVAEYCGAPHAVAVNSATSALHIACMALGLGPGDLLWTSPITFLASANCARYCGAEVGFIDIDADSFNLSPPRLRERLVEARAAGRLPKIVVPVHLAGQSCDMVAIHALAQEFGFRVIEDASHAIGSRYLGEPVGCGRYSDVTVFSFHPVKIVTTAEGGMALTRDAALAQRMAMLRSHGMTRDPALMSGDSDGAWYYEQTMLGYNYRLTDLQAALGLSQLARLDDYVACRHRIAARYDAAFAGSVVRTPWRDPDAHSAFHLYVVRVPAAQRLAVFDMLRAANIGVNLHYIPLYRQPYHRPTGHTPADWPEAERYYAEAISLPMYPTLPEAEQQRVVEVLLGAVAA